MLSLTIRSKIDPETILPKKKKTSAGKVDFSKV
jgi:hypothetical protein